MPARGDRIDALERFLALVDFDESGCWLWRGYIWDSGYACFWEGDKNVRASRWVTQMVWGMPDYLEPDHLCRVKDCVNPWHLEPVTAKENVRRSNSPAGINARKVVCMHGHPLTGENLYVTPEGRRQCSTCRAQRSREWQLRRLAKCA